MLSPSSCSRSRLVVSACVWCVPVPSSVCVVHERESLSSCNSTSISCIISISSERSSYTSTSVSVCLPTDSCTRELPTLGERCRRRRPRSIFRSNKRERHVTQQRFKRFNTKTHGARQLAVVPTQRSSSAARTSACVCETIREGDHQRQRHVPSAGCAGVRDQIRPTRACLGRGLETTHGDARESIPWRHVIDQRR